MALIRPSSVVSEVRGSIGDVVFSRTRAGMIARNRNIPVMPPSDRYDAAQAIMTLLHVDWLTALTDNDRQAWRNYADAHHWPGRFGQKIWLDGRNWFIRTNFSRALAHARGLIIVPPPGPPLPLPRSSLTWNNNTRVLGITPGNLNPRYLNHRLLVYVYASRPAGPTARTANSAWRFAGHWEYDQELWTPTPTPITYPWDITTAGTMFLAARVQFWSGQISKSTYEGPFNVS